MNDLGNLIPKLRDLEDRAVCKAIADRLDELGDERAPDVRQLADASPVVPTGRARYLLYLTCSVDDDDPPFALTTFEPADGAGAYEEWREEGGIPRERLPMACGPWWSIDLRPDGVFAHVHDDTPQSDKVLSLLPVPPRRKLDVEDYALGVELDASRMTPANVLRAFDFSRRVLIAGLLGLRLSIDPASSSPELRDDRLTLDAAFPASVDAEWEWASGHPRRKSWVCSQCGVPFKVKYGAVPATRNLKVRFNAHYRAEDCDRSWAGVRYRAVYDLDSEPGLIRVASRRPIKGDFGADRMKQLKEGGE